MNIEEQDRLLQRGIALQESGELESAIRIYSALAQQDPKYAPAWDALGLAMYQSGYSGDAIVFIRCAIKLRPNEESFQNHLAEIYREQRRAGVALTEYGLLGAAKLASDLARTHLGAGDLDPAELAVRQARLLQPHDSAIAQLFARILFERGAAQEATQAYRATLAAPGRQTLHARAQGLREYCENHRLPYKTLRAASITRSFLPRGWQYDTVATPEKPTPEFGVGEVRDAIFIGGESLLWTNAATAIHALIERPDLDRFELTSSIVKMHNRRDLLIDAPEQTTEVFERGIQFFGDASGNFSHWLIEFMPRFAALTEMLASSPEYSNWPLLVDEVGLKDQHQREIFNTLNTRQHPVVILRAHERYHCKRLLVPTSFTSMPMNLKSNFSIAHTDVVIDRVAAEFVRKQFPTRRFDHLPRRRLYLERGGNFRLLRNEGDVKAIFLRHGFEPIEAHTLSFGDKLALFGSAEVIAGPGSSAFTNIVFAPNDVKVLWLVSEAWREGVFLSSIAGHCSQRLLNVFCKDIPGTHGLPYHNDYTADLQEVEAALGCVLSMS